jgi:hypothetical protein
VAVDIVTRDYTEDDVDDDKVRKLASRDFSTKELPRTSGRLNSLYKDKDSVGASGSIKHTVPLSKDSEIEFMTDLAARLGKDSKIEVPYIGAQYRKRFSKGGVTKSASKRADGIAQRGKTRGKMV